MKEPLPKQVYTNEYREQAVLLVTRDGLSIAEAARRLSMSLQTLANWVKRAKDGQPAASAASGEQRVVTEAQAELSRLRREVAELRMERDILKNVWLRRPGQAQYERSSTRQDGCSKCIGLLLCGSLRLPNLDGVSALATS